MSSEAAEALFLPRFLWRFNDELQFCYLCRVEFCKLARVKQYCELCGYMFCNKCLSGNYLDVRVCFRCQVTADYFLSKPNEGGAIRRELKLPDAPESDREVIKQSHPHYHDHLTHLVRWFVKQFGSQCRGHVCRRIALTSLKGFYGNGMADRVWEGMCYYIAHRDVKPGQVGFYFYFYFFLFPTLFFFSL